jgi:hypothetical protein
MVEIFGNVYEHLTIVRAIGNPVYAYLVRADEGYCLRVESETGVIYKMVSTIYEREDAHTVTVIPETEVPEVEEINGDVTPDIETVTE